MRHLTHIRGTVWHQPALFGSNRTFERPITFGGDTTFERHHSNSDQHCSNVVDSTNIITFGGSNVLSTSFQQQPAPLEHPPHCQHGRESTQQQRWGLICYTWSSIHR
jgi:hypothetical protein